MNEHFRRAELKLRLQAIGSFASIADELGLHYTAISQWLREIRVPEGRRQALIDLAAERGVTHPSGRPLEPDDFDVTDLADSWGNHDSDTIA